MNPVLDGLTGRVALVTGSSSGIGKATALELSGRGVSVAVHSRSLARADRVVEEISRRGGEAVALAADLQEPEAACELVEQAGDRLGRIDVLVNNAGRSVVSESDQLPAAEWRSALELMLTAPFLCARAFARQLPAERDGVIINVASILGHVGLPRRAAYVAAKHGLIGLTRALACEWAERGIRVISIDPAYVSTDLVEESMRDGSFDRKSIEGRTPLGRLADPEEIARVVCFLASEEASYVSGSNVLVDGGWTAYGGW